MALDQSSADHKRKNCDLQSFFVFENSSWLPFSECLSLCLHCTVFVCFCVWLVCLSSLY